MLLASAVHFPEEQAIIMLAEIARRYIMPEISTNIFFFRQTAEQALCAVVWEGYGASGLKMQFNTLIIA